MEVVPGVSWSWSLNVVVGEGTCNESGGGGGMDQWIAPALSKVANCDGNHTLHAKEK